MVQSSETTVAALNALHTFLPPFLIQVHSKPIDYTPLSRCNGSYYRYLESARGITHQLWLLRINMPIHTDTCVYSRVCVHASASTLSQMRMYIHTQIYRCMWSDTHSQRNFCTLSFKQTCLAPKPNIFSQGGWETAGRLFDVADSPRVSNEGVDYALIRAPSPFLGQAVDTARLSHTSRWAQWTQSSTVWIQMIYAQLAIRLQPGVECDCLEECTSLLGSPN